MDKPLTDRLASIYYDPKNPASFSSIDKLYKAAKTHWPDVTKRGVIKWLRAQETYSVHKPRKENFPRARILSYGPRYLMAADLAQFDSIAKYNSGIRYILFVIDTFSKRLFLYPLKKKTAVLVAQAFEKLFAEHYAPLFLTSDLGSEFFNYELTKVLTKYGIHQFPARNKVKSPMVERVIRTIKGKIYRIMTKFNTRRFIDFIDDIEKSYNDTHHSSIKMAPNKVTDENAAIVFRNLYPNYYKNLATRPTFRLKLGDRVRVATKSQTWEKAYKPRFSKEIYTISKMFPSHPPRYAIKDKDGDDIAGTFYEEELQFIGK